MYVWIYIYCIYIYIYKSVWERHIQSTLFTLRTQDNLASGNLIHKKEMTKHRSDEAFFSNLT